MKRIRYQVQNGVLQSVKTFAHPDNGGQFVVRLHPERKEFEIYDVVAQGVSYRKNGTNMNHVKILAKKALQELGVDVGERETRVIKD